MTEDHLAHFGVKGMRWGKRLKDRDGAIRSARSNQKERKTEIKALKKEKLKATSEVGRQKLDAAIKDKKYARKMNPDAIMAKQKTSAEHIMKGTAVTAVMAATTSALYLAVTIGVAVGKLAVDAGEALSED